MDETIIYVSAEEKDLQILLNGIGIGCAVVGVAIATVICYKFHKRRQINLAMEETKESKKQSMEDQTFENPNGNMTVNHSAIRLNTIHQDGPEAKISCPNSPNDSLQEESNEIGRDKKFDTKMEKEDDPDESGDLTPISDENDNSQI